MTPLPVNCDTPLTLGTGKQQAALCSPVLLLLLQAPGMFKNTLDNFLLACTWSGESTLFLRNHSLSLGGLGQPVEHKNNCSGARDFRQKASFLCSQVKSPHPPEDGGCQEVPPWQHPARQLLPVLLQPLELVPVGLKHLPAVVQNGHKTQWVEGTRSGGDEDE